MGATTIEQIASTFDNFLFKFGRKVIADAKVIIWDGVDPYLGWLAADTLFSVVSTDAADKVGGGGATHIKFIYQDLAGVEYTSPEIALNGDTAVDIPTILGSSSAVKIIFVKPIKECLLWSKRFFVNKFVKAQLDKNKTADNTNTYSVFFIKVSMTTKE